MKEINLKYGLFTNAITNCKRKSDGVANAAEQGNLVVVKNHHIFAIIFVAIFFAYIIY